MNNIIDTNIKEIQSSASNLNSMLVDDICIMIEINKSKRLVSSRLEILFEYLLKITYVTRNTWHDDWKKTIIQCMRELEFELNAYDNDIIVNYINEIIDDCYDNAVSHYKEAAKDTFYYLRQNLDLIPEKCPWTTEDIIKNLKRDPYVLILGYLPEPDLGLTYLQIFSRVCIYLDGYTYTYNVPSIQGSCRFCRNYEECLKSYEDLKGSY